MTGAFITPNETGTLSDPPPINYYIRGAIEGGMVPILPFEMQLLRQKLQGFAHEQKVLGATMTAAMSESSETWHDNAAAEAITNDSITLSSRALGTDRIIQHRYELAYPEGEQPVTLGSIIGLQFGSSPEVESYLLTGAVRELSPEVESVLPAHTEVITLGSPMGEALLDTVPGETVSYEVNSRNIGMTVVRVSQLGDLLNT